MLRLLREAHLNGWRLAASADVSAKYVHQVEIRQLRINFEFYTIRSLQIMLEKTYCIMTLYFKHRQNVFVVSLKEVTLYVCGKITLSGKRPRLPRRRPLVVLQLSGIFLGSFKHSNLTPSFPTLFLRALKGAAVPVRPPHSAAACSCRPDQVLA